MIAYLTDVEGRWDRLVSFCEGNPAITLSRGHLYLAEGASLVYGGDVFDRGPAGRRLAKVLVEARLRYGDRVVLLAGNRDINKLRLPRELGGSPPAGAPEANLPQLLRWILANTMGARDAFDHRHAELTASGEAGDDDAVVASFLDDVGRDGIVRAYLDQAVLAWRAGDLLFVHGGIPDAAFLALPDGGTAMDVDGWVNGLNRWYRTQLAAFDRAPTPAEAPPWWPLIAYQMPQLPEKTHDSSVVYGRNTTGQGNNPALPSAEVRAGLRAAGVGRLVVGHTPNGDFPSTLVDESGFTLIVADASYPRSATCPQVLLGPTGTRIRGRVVLDDGRELGAEADLPGDPWIGRWDEDGWLPKARLETGERLYFRFADGTRYEQIAR